MHYKDYIRKEAEILYNYIIDDEENFNNKKNIFIQEYIVTK